MLRESGRCGSCDAAPRVRRSMCGCFRPAEEKEPAQAPGGHGACSCPGLEGYEATSELSAHGAVHHSVLLVLQSAGGTLCRPKAPGPVGVVGRP